MMDQIARAAKAIAAADAVLIGSGAGMGVDSGLPDFRGNEGFWRAYPPFRKLGLSFFELANPRWFDTDPALAWGFYGHRLNLYRATTPHDGFRKLLEIVAMKPGGYFVFTSNVDGHFQKAGFAAERIVECHGSIHHCQCSAPCCNTIDEVGELEVAVDEETFRARGPLPRCPSCGRIARPNVLMFGDYRWVGDRTEEQLQRYRGWLGSLDGRRLAILECGAGGAVPTVRYECESLRGTLIRVNPRECDVPAGGIGIPLGAREAIGRLHAFLNHD
jgi:NAD-dependent SIR2 family protein deacetylase